MPSFIYSWHVASQDVDKTANQVRVDAPKMAYFFPHPALFVRGESAERKEQYLRNWLMSRSAWITRLSACDSSPVPSRSWHNFLNSIPANFTSTHSGWQLQATADLFRLSFIRSTHEEPSEVQFHNLTLNLTSLGTLDKTTKGKILTNTTSDSNWSHSIICYVLKFGRTLTTNILTISDRYDYQ